MVLVQDKSGNSNGVDANFTGSPALLGQSSYNFVQDNTTLAATTGSTPVVNITGGQYVFDAQFTGTSLTLQALGSDNVTWRDEATLTSSGSTTVVIGQGSSVRIYNPNGTADTLVSASLS